MKKTSLSSTAAAAAAAGVPPKPTFAAPIPVKPPAPIPHVSASPSPATSRTPSTPAGVSPKPGGTGGQNQDDLARRVAEAKKRVAEAQTKLANKDNPYLSMASQPSKKNKQQPPAEPTQQGAGLKMAAHPLLLDTTPSAPQSKKDRYKPMQPKFASIKANARNAPTPPPPPPPVATPDTSNPYAAGSAKDTGFEGAPKERTGRSFRFNPKGKYMALGNQMRHDIQLEALKQRIAESARKAGLDGEMGVEKGLKRPPPPVAEWWDAALLPSSNYEDLTMGMENINIYTHDSPITIYIQHPIPIPGPDANKTEYKPLMLTTKERKKMRKRRRADALKDKNDRIRMGLLPPDPPKVRISNLMKVLTSDAIQDPTRVEARVRREVAMRKHNHEKMNAERKLTDEQRREKIENKKVEEEKRGIYGCVYKIKNLSDPSHQFKIRVNAEQLNLSGVCIFHSQFNVVYVEGAAKFIKQFKRLMLHRIAWTEAARARGSAEDVELENPDSDVEDDGNGEGTSASAAKAATKGATPGTGAEEDGNAATSLENNRCYLIWEGQVRDRSFSNFRGKACPTERDAKEVLGEKLRGYWDQAKNWRPEEEELF
ncbi:PRP3-domain-containing protein [Pluteus cervinus]|uniref:PRP3-domain-containing protein n=1 Tax=Pluteus cervinus TaxID=181527 RepID=A0ACD3AA08_9AGAR|nr:PRP3-domain-containing protein [Pluteus cervinus]